ncbi:NADH-quinone oxidoreductase subunit A [Carboxydocella sporoproducens DSM 16521]|uniref:NADH-quinone oxidoreductase subunit A n=2 Tax=Carboxydocella TaxID=178898 RepID=A0A1T4LKP5_9FIRM|nr:MULTISPECIES: NADH-quinone oxidoreductase subunit A [Carboxydocella]AVX20500.1 NADH dehydrogenase subunit A [Carboxydocella thermautotrophica]AVX30921.1 NADH dehydrogenase subunit A [Carboxydocella thermautotrophica]SJZ55078.1 NADH-quinone oxidoreductase subunit A [Carboxydocella sporoproducens DSM 16521]
MSLQFAGIGAILLVAMAFPVIILFVSRLLSPKRSAKYKYTTYECGLETQGDTWIQFKTSYFMYALLFVAFDVETVFLYPWAVKFKVLGTFAFVEMFIFIAILILGFWYAWKEGALEWM